MGRPMTRNLARAGFPVRAWNRTPRSLPDLAAAGVELHKELISAVQDADVICMCVLDDQAVRDVLGQIWDVLQPGCIIIDHTTTHVTTAREMSQRARQYGVHYLDAPVSGGVAGAEAGTLSIMVGGDEESFRRVQPVLQCLGSLIRYLGPPGSGQATKLVNQLLTAVHQAAAVEALYLAQRYGLDIPAVHEVLAASYGSSRMLDRTVPVILDGDYNSPFAIRLLNKDLGLIHDWAQQMGVSAPLLETAYQVYRQALQRGLGNKDAAALIQLLSQDIPPGDDGR